jgi:hypothetical protein
MGLVPESALLIESEIRLISGFHNLASKERIEEVTEKENGIDQASSVMRRNRFGWGPNVKMSWLCWLNMNHLFGSVKRERRDQAESLGLTAIEHHRKNTEDEPRGFIFKHDLIGGNR